MFKNNLKIAWRSLKKHPFFTFLNIFGLAIGMAGGILVSLYIYDELSYDRMFVDADRIYRINTDMKFGGEEKQLAVTAAPMAEALLHDIPQIQQTTRIRTIGDVWVKSEKSETNVREVSVAYADSTLFTLLGIKLLYGNTQTALSIPNTMVMTRSAARKHFSLKEAVGQTVILNDNETYTVTGIVPDLPENSFLSKRGVFLSMAGYAPSQKADWTSLNFYTLFKLAPGTQIGSIQNNLDIMVDKYVIPFVQRYYPGVTKQQFVDAGNYMLFSTMPLADIHLYSHRIAESSRNGDIQDLYTLALIGLFLVILACVNFMNLSTAQSLKRAKEVGIRKTLGSHRSNLIGQFLTEAGFISFASLLLGLLISIIVLPLFNQLAGKTLIIPITNLFFWLILLSAGLILGLLSGGYPAFFLSRFVPSKVLKGSGISKVEGGGTRNALVVFQFAISIFLIVGTMVIFQQLRFIKEKKLGYGKDQVLAVNDIGALGGKMETFKREVEQLGGVKSTTMSSFLPTPSPRNSRSYQRADNPGQEHSISLQNWGVDYDYLSTLDIELLAGRNFDQRFGTDSSAVLLNETAVAVLGKTPEEVLGLQFMNSIITQENESRLTVIGVVKNFHFESLREDIGSLSLFLGGVPEAMAIKLEPGDLSVTLAQIEAIWQKMVPSKPFNHYFLDDSFNQSYEAEQHLGRIFMIFTLLSFLIACLGLFGLAAFNAEKRTKEIGVRKVLGASIGQIAYRLSIDFVKLVGVAIAVSLPFGWYVMNLWLQDFSYRIEVPWWVLVLAALLAVGIAILTVSYQSIKAALVNPVKSLRTE